jgi:hypothetical protein
MVVPVVRELAALQMLAVAVAVAVVGLVAAAVAAAMTTTLVHVNPLAAAVVPRMPMQALLPA